MTESVFNRLAAEALHPSPYPRNLCRPRHAAAVDVPQAGQRAVHLPARSVHGGERFGRYSIIGLASPTRLVVRGHQVLVLSGNRIAEREDDTNPLDFIGKYMKRFRAAPVSGLPRFCGGLVGCLGYDTVRYVETKLTRYAQGR